jgi:hypothetical protein
MSTNIIIAEKPFDCVKLSEADFSYVIAIYVILCIQENGDWTVLDVGKKEQLTHWADNPDMKEIWTKNCPENNIWVGACPMPPCSSTTQDFERVEAAIRKQYNLPLEAE